MNEQEIILSVDAPPACARCGGPSLLKAEFSHSWKNAAGQEVTGMRAVVLCPGCDRGEASADTLLAVLPMDGTLDTATVAACTDQITAWVDTIRARTVDTDRLNAEHEAWRSGELDGPSDHRLP